MINTLCAKQYSVNIYGYYFHYSADCLATLSQENATIHLVVAKWLVFWLQSFYLPLLGTGNEYLLSCKITHNLDGNDYISL